MLLIFPPVSKPCEPPAGVALLSSALKENKFSCQIYDANINGLLYLISSDIHPIDIWSKRALKKKEKILYDLKNPELYKNKDRYHQRIYDLNKILSISVNTKRFKISLSDYSDNKLSALNSKDLLESAKSFEQNPFFSFFEYKIKDKILNSHSKYIGISLCFLNQALVGFALMGWIKSNFKDKKIIAGGGLISSWMNLLGFENPFGDLIDFMIENEGEQPLLDILGAKNINKKYYIPDYDFVKKDLYIAPGKILPFRTSIGCYWNKCKFCPEPLLKRNFDSEKSLKTLNSLKYIEKKYSPDYIHFIDNAIPFGFLEAMAKDRFNFKWYGFVRFEKELCDQKFCFDLKKSGCIMLKLGLESGDQNILNKMNKGIDLNMASIILKNLYKAGILSFVHLLFGTKFEDKQAALKTFEYIQKHEKYIDYLNLAVFNLPRSIENKEYFKTKEFYQGDLSFYLDFSHPFGWNRKNVKQFLDKTFKKQIKVNKTPAFFSSNHAAFFAK